MKNLLSLFAFAALAVPAWSAPQTVTLSIPAMNCAACPIAVKKALTRLEGVVTVKSDLDKRQTTVVFDDARVNLADMTQATKEAGFPSTVLGGKP
jgi:periplasmic mercuric ion binding protein